MRNGKKRTLVVSFHFQFNISYVLSAWINGAVARFVGFEKKHDRFNVKNNNRGNKKEIL